MSDEEKQHGVSVHTGFPNPATDRSLDTLDLHQLLVPRPNSMFLFRIRGNKWKTQGIFDGDIAVIDRALAPRKGDRVVWWHEAHGEFAISLFENVPHEANVWGVVTSTIHQFVRETRASKAKGQNR
ncbi:MAG TPA: S24 family peptidase [Candidatus Saccharimonadales bacterium]